MIEALLKSAMDVYKVMSFLRLYPEVMLAALAAYFITRQRYGMEKWSVWIPVGISFIGQMAFSWPGTLQQGFMAFTMGWLQAGIAIGSYSFLDKYGIMDRAGKFVQKKIDEKEQGADNAVDKK